MAEEFKLDLEEGSDAVIQESPPSIEERYGGLGHIPLAILNGEGSAVDVARPRPSHRWKIKKRVEKQLMLAEEWIDFVQKKKQ